MRAPTAIRALTGALLTIVAIGAGGVVLAGAFEGRHQIWVVATATLVLGLLVKPATEAVG